VTLDQTAPDSPAPQPDSSLRPGWRRRPRGWRLVASLVLGAVLLSAGVAIGIQITEGVSAGTQYKVSPPAGSSPEQIPAITKPPATVTPAKECDRRQMIGTVVPEGGVTARKAPDSQAAPIQHFGYTSEFGSHQVFDLVRRVPGTGGYWYKALLPMRPNGTYGFVPAKALAVTTTKFRLVLDRGRFHMSLFNGCRRLKLYKVGIGVGDTPTPVGRFYLHWAVRVSKPDTVYGTYAFGLSAFSEVLTNWTGGGIIGLHGTNDPSSVGVNSSHGCIRMYNWAIEELIHKLPLGTPIVIK
jgi:L,D-transpeptidase catalytic domain